MLIRGVTLALHSVAYSLFFMLCSIFCNGQNSVIDSLVAIVEKNPTPDTNRVNLLIQLSFTEHGITPENAKKHAHEALQLSKQLHFVKGEGYSYRILGIGSWIKGEYQKSIEYGLQMLSIFEESANKRGIAAAYTLLAAAYLELEDYTTASSYLRKAIKLDKEIGNKSELTQNYNRYGGLLMYTHQYDSALIWYQQNLKLRKEMNDRNGVAQAYNNIGSVLIDKKQYNEAIDYLHKAFALYKDIGDNKISIGGACQNLGKAYLLKGDYKNAEFYLKQALAIAVELKTLKEQQGVYGVFTELEEARGNFKKALEYQKLSQSILDSIYNEDKAESLAEAETQYETIKKEQAIKLLEKEKQIQSIWQYLLIGGVFFIGVIYFMQRSRTKKTKELLQVQKVLNSKLQETDLLKSRFFANISHEFRTPLSLILAPIEEKIKSSSISSVDKEDLKLVSRNANRLLNLVNQLLDLSKIEAGKMELQLIDGNLKDFFVIVAASFESLAKSKSIVFNTTISLPGNPVKFDANKLETILTNILFNAFKYTPPNGIVTLDAQAVADDNTMIIKISDTGKGIPEEDLPHIFSPFYQSRHTADDGQIGTGLGLALVNELVKVYNGNIVLTSHVNTGTCITIILPMPASEEGAKQTTWSVLKKQLTADLAAGTESESADTEIDSLKDVVLIIEDNQDLRNFMASSFNDQFSIITANDGEEGLNKAIELIPDLIISDVMMPNMDGVELTQQLKSDERTSHIPVILLTAKADSNSRMEGLRTGADDFIAKPFSNEEIRVRAANLIEQRKKLASKFAKEFSQPQTKVKEPSIDDKFMLRVKSVIETSMSNSSFSVEKLAEEMHLSRTQLFRKLKAIIGTSPTDLINDMRLERAAELIRSKADTLTQISYSVGFNEQSYFAKRFRKKFGKSPSEYAESN